jgi:hypothetical protein
MVKILTRERNYGIMKKIILLTITALTFTACGGVWVHPTKPKEKQIRDKKECEYEAITSTTRTGNAISDGLAQGRIIRMCMELRGYNLEYPQQ